MPIIGDHPESGVRFVLERPFSGGPPWLYDGHAFTPAAKFPLQAQVTADGTVTISGASPPEIAEKARLVLRALYKQSASEADGSPPRKIVRWRGEK